jgi:hypothetical protein
MFYASRRCKGLNELLRMHAPGAELARIIWLSNDFEQCWQCFVFGDTLKLPKELCIFVTTRFENVTASGNFGQVHFRFEPSWAFFRTVGSVSSLVLWH